MKKRLFSILLTACLLVGLLPTAALAADGDVDYLYCDANGANWATGTKAAREYILVTGSDTAWSAGWYVVNSDVTIGTADAPQRVTVSGSVHLILTDGCTLTVNGGIQVQDSDNNSAFPSPNSLTIYGQTTPLLDETGNVTNNVGKLIATGGRFDAGIGGSKNGGNGGAITINGGVVTATGDYGAGIGGGEGGLGNGGDGGTITINGGVVRATGGNGGAGIGGGYGMSNGGDGGTITISGGTVMADGGNGGAGIGGGSGDMGNGGAGGNITISGGTVKATGDYGSVVTGIGGGRGSSGSGSSGSFRTTDTGNAVIYTRSIADQSDQSNWSGIIFLDWGLSIALTSRPGTVYGNQTLTDYLTIPGGYTLTILEGASLTVPGIYALSIQLGTTLVNEGTLYSDGNTVIQAGGTLTNNGAIYVGGDLSGTVSGALYYPLILSDCTVDTTNTTAANTSTVNGKTYGKVGETIYLAATPSKNQLVKDWSGGEPSDKGNGRMISSMPANMVSVAAMFATALTITQQPTGGAIDYGETTTLSVAVRPHSSLDSRFLTYMWYQDGSLVAMTGSRYTTPDNLAAGEHTYTCTITYSAGIDNYTVTSAPATVTVTPLAEAAPNISIDYENETLTGFVSGSSYTIGDAAVTPIGGKLSVVDYIGSNISIVTKARDGNHADSAPQTLTIPARPAAPASSEYTIDYINETISFNSDIYEVNTDSGFGRETTLTSSSAVPPGSTLYIRQKAVAGSSFAGEATRVTIPARPAAPASSECTIDYINETISFNSNIYEVNTAAAFTGTPVENNSTVTPGSTLYIRQKAVANTGFKSEAQSVTILTRPVAPTPVGVKETVDGKNDGQITGLTAGAVYQISVDGGTTWQDKTADTDGKITGLAPGAYQVRVKATGSAFASLAADATIDVGAPKTYTLNITSTHTFAATVYGNARPAAQAITIESSGNWQSAIADVTVDSTDFIIGGSGSTVAAGGSIDTWTVQPAAGLGAGTHTATITVTYNDGATATAAVSFTVSPKDITVSITQGGGTYGGTITPAFATLSGVVDGDSVPVILTYTGTVNDGISYNSAAVPTQAGSYTVTASISNSNYNLSETETAPITVPFTVNKATVSAPAIAGKTYTGSNLTADVPASERYNVTANAGGTDVGDYDVTLTLADANNYTWADGTDGAAKTLTFTIAQATNAWDTEPNASVWQAGWVYGGSAPTDYGTPKFGTVEVSCKDADEISYIGLPTNAGTYTISFNVLGNDNYTSLNLQINNVTIRKAAQDAPGAPTVKSKTWNSVTLEEIPDNANGAKAQYSMDGGMTWQDSPTFTGLKSTTEYSFVARYAETDNYFASPASEPVVVTTNNVPVSTYPPTVEQPDEGGSVTTSPKNPTAGSRVIITPEPDEGYEVDSVTVTDKNGNPVKVTDNGDGTYSFTQPSGKVTIQVVFSDTTVIPFVDVPAGAYYCDAVVWAAENGITSGVDAAHFAPNGICTRAQAVTFLWRAAGCPAPKSSEMPFKDVVKGSYYYDAVLWAVENGITKGTSDTTFSPDATCTRGQIVTFLWRSQKSPTSDSVNPFTDVAADAYYADAVLWAVKEDITNGTSSTTFSPDADCTRAQIVTFLWRALNE